MMLYVYYIFVLILWTKSHISHTPPPPLQEYVHTDVTFDSRCPQQFRNIELINLVKPTIPKRRNDDWVVCTVYLCNAATSEINQYFTILRVVRMKRKGEKYKYQTGRLATPKRILACNRLIFVSRHIMSSPSSGDSQHDDFASNIFKHFSH